MKTITATLRLELPDDMVETITSTAGVHLPHPIDGDLAVLMAAYRQIPTVIRNFLLAPGRKPPKYDVPIQFSADKSQTGMFLTIHAEAGATAAKSRKTTPRRKKS